MTELLSPAGTLKNMRYALAYGADAVYAGQPRYSLRVRQNDFDKLEHLARGIQETHIQGKKFFVASNLLPHNAKLKTFLADITPIIEMQPDALIMADPGLIMMVRERWPQMPIHLSVQANTMNYASVKFWQNLGITRIILSRELSLDEISEIRQQCPDIELEVFVHGALCVAYSGRCLLSGYLNHRDANQGACTNACRWNYKVHQTKADDTNYLLEEKSRPNEYMPIFEDEQGTYILNSKDLRAVQHINRLMEIGINSLKIEGRTKSYYYAARTTQVYRKAIDLAAAGKPFDTTLLTELDNLSNRGYTEGFFRRHAPEDYQNYQFASSTLHRQQFVGEVLGYSDETKMLEIAVKNHFEQGDHLELMHPQGNQHFILEHLENQRGENISQALGSGYIVHIRAPVEKSVMYGLLLKDLGKS